MQQNITTQNINSVSSTPFLFIEKWEEFERFIDKALSQTHENAIETLLYISKKLKRHRALHYTVLNGKDEKLKNIYYEDLQRRIEFAQKKIALNFVEGQRQNVYRNDISTEMVSRNFAKRILDLHNPKIFPPQKISFQTIYRMLFDDFIKSISTQDGLQYYTQMVHY